MGRRVVAIACTDAPAHIPLWVVGDLQEFGLVRRLELSVELVGLDERAANLDDTWPPAPLVFGINASGTGLADSVVTGLVALVNTTALDVTTTLRRDDDEFIGTGPLAGRAFRRAATPHQRQEREPSDRGPASLGC